MDRDALSGGSRVRVARESSVQRCCTRKMKIVKFSLSGQVSLNLKLDKSLFYLRIVPLVQNFGERVNDWQFRVVLTFLLHLKAQNRGHKFSFHGLRQEQRTFQRKGPIQDLVVGGGGLGSATAAKT